MGLTLMTVLPVFCYGSKVLRADKYSRSCRRLRSFDLVLDLLNAETTKDQDQKIAAFGSSYRCWAQKRHCSAINSEAADCSGLSPGNPVKPTKTLGDTVGTEAAMTSSKHCCRESCMPESAVYPINPPAAHRIVDETEALRVAERVAAVLLEQDAERDRSRQVPAGDCRPVFQQRSVGRQRAAGIRRCAGVLRGTGAGDRDHFGRGSIPRADPAKPLLPAGRHSPARHARATGAFLWPRAARSSVRQRAVGNWRQERAGHPGDHSPFWRRSCDQRAQGVLHRFALRTLAGGAGAG